MLDIEERDQINDPLRKDRTNDALYLALQRLTDEINAPQASVFVAGVERLERVAQVALGRVMGQVRGHVGTATLRPIPRADDGVSHHQRDVVRVAPATALDSDGDVRERHIVVTDADFRAGEATAGRQRSLAVSRLGTKSA